MQKHRVLIVEDEQDIAGLIKHTLERSGNAEAEIVGSGDAALKAVTARPPTSSSSTSTCRCSAASKCVACFASGPTRATCRSSC